jgi:peptide chain release factor 1
MARLFYARISPLAAQHTCLHLRAAADEPLLMPDLSSNLIRKLDDLAAEHTALEAQMLDPAVLSDHRRMRAVSIRRAALEPIVRDYREYRDATQQVEELTALLNDAKTERELADLARGELPHFRAQSQELIETLQRRLVTSDDQSVVSVILEVRAGVGGDEAGIWAGDLVNMYTRFALARGWHMEELQSSPAEHGGFKNAIFSIRGEGVWSALGYESGTHQVKRVPATEAAGRVHTSTATVAVLPEPEEIEVKIAPEDVKEMLTTSQGPGGQNVNKVATAVHLIHIPTGIEVRMQETKSQTQNRQRAWQLLRARLYERQQAEAHAQRAEQRRSMIGGAGRAEKIRTYRWKENIVVDHRLSEEDGSSVSFNLADVMAGNLQPLIDRLQAHDIAERVAHL